METLTKNPFGVDEIHAVRLQIAEERKKMTPQEAKRAFNLEVANVRHEIETIRKNKATKGAVQ